MVLLTLLLSKMPTDGTPNYTIMVLVIMSWSCLIDSNTIELDSTICLLT